MTEKELTQEKELQETTAQTADDKPVPAADGGHSGAGIGILALLISLGAAAGTGWLWFHQQSTNQAVHEAVNRAEQGQKEASAKLATLTAEFGAQKNQTANLLAQAASKQSALEDSVKQIYIDISNNRDVWKLEEVDQLLTVAGERMQLANDKKTALAALQLADKRLATMGDPSMLPLREKVSDAINKLKSVGEDDISGVALKIRSLIKQVDQLPFNYDPGLEHTSSVAAPAIIYSAEQTRPPGAQPAAPTQPMPGQAAEAMPATPRLNPEPPASVISETSGPTAAEPAQPAASTPQPLSEVVESAAQQPDVAARPPSPVTAVETANTADGPQAAPGAVVAESVENETPVMDSGSEAAPGQADAAGAGSGNAASQGAGPAAEAPAASLPVSAVTPEKAPAVETPRPQAAPAAPQGATVPPALRKLKQGASKFFGELWNDTKKAFDYQVLDRAAKPLLTPDQKYFITENIKLALNAAQLAALQGDETSYRDNLAQAGDWARQYFAADTPQLKSFTDTLAELQQVDVSPEWPDISGVLQELRIIKERKAGQ